MERSVCLCDMCGGQPDNDKKYRVVFKHTKTSNEIETFSLCEICFNLQVSDLMMGRTLNKKVLDNLGWPAPKEEPHDD